MTTFWETRYATEGAIWGHQPSKTVERAHTQFRQCGIQTLLIPGSGNGSNVRLFTDSGYDVTGIEISETALALAQARKLFARTSSTQTKS